MTKQCFKCKQVLPLTDFYKHSQMADGHLNKCKGCAKRDVASNYNKNFSYYQQYDKQRFQRPDRKAKVQQYAQKYPRKYASTAVNNAVRDGRLTRQPCEVCGTTTRVEGHHDDYSKPLSVRWLCFVHNRMVHGQMTAEARALHVQQET